jgi:hypothetical protein
MTPFFGSPGRCTAGVCAVLATAGTVAYDLWMAGTDKRPLPKVTVLSAVFRKEKGVTHVLQGSEALESSSKPSSSSCCGFELDFIY